MTDTTTPTSLRFNQLMFDAIQDGRKTVTRRLVRTVQPKYEVGTIVHARCFPLDDVIPLRITGVDRGSIDDITDDEAALEGVDSADGLRDMLHALYPTIKESVPVWRIEFERIGDVA